MDLRMAILLHEIRVRASALDREKRSFDRGTVDAAYGQAFRDYGIDVEELKPEEAAQRIQASSIHGELVAALTNWASARAFAYGRNVQGFEKLIQVTRLADPGADEIRSPEKLVRFAAAVRVEAAPVVTLVAIGNALWKHGRRMEAVALLEKAQRRYPRDFWVNHQLACYLELSNPARLEEAIGYYRVACALHPQSPGAHMNLGNALRAKKDLDGAMHHFQTALEIDPNYARAHSNLGSLLRAKKDPEGAIRHFRRALEIDPNSPDAVLVHCNLGHALVATNPAAAERHYRRALEIDPNDAPAHADLGHALLVKNDTDEAIRHLRRSLEIDPNYAHAHSNLGTALLDKNDPNGAIPHCMKAVKIDPNYAAPHYTLGRALTMKADPEGAQRHYRRALEIDPNHAEAHCNLGHILADQGRFAEALPALKRGHELGSRRGPKWRYPSAQWVKNCERMLDLEKRLPAVLKGEAASSAELLGLAELCLTCKKRYADAVVLYRQAFAVEPKRASYLGTGHCYNAACAAVLAASGKGAGADKLDNTDNARLRRQALDWLNADRAGLAKLFAEKPATARSIQNAMQHWLNDSDLSSVRDTKEMAALPHEEREAWKKLWNEARDLLRRAQKK
jgi:tetratricopeptide (TPR) repeat protein